MRLFPTLRALTMIRSSRRVYAVYTRSDSGFNLPEADDRRANCATGRRDHATLRVVQHDDAEKPVHRHALP